MESIQARALGSYSTLAYAKRVRVSLKGKMNASLQQIDHSENAARCNCNCHSLTKVANSTIPYSSGERE